jgi:hypothetical protein
MEWSKDGGCWLTPREFVWAMNELRSDEVTELVDSAQALEYMRGILRRLECQPDRKRPSLDRISGDQGARG